MSITLLISNVQWKKNNAVHSLSIFKRSNNPEEIAKVARYDRKSKRHVEVDCKQFIREYNARMGA